MPDWKMVDRYIQGRASKRDHEIIGYWLQHSMPFHKLIIDLKADEAARINPAMVNKFGSICSICGELCITDREILQKLCRGCRFDDKKSDTILSRMRKLIRRFCGRDRKKVSD